MDKVLITDINRCNKEVLGGGKKEKALENHLKSSPQPSISSSSFAPSQVHKTQKKYYKCIFSPRCVSNSNEEEEACENSQVMLSWLIDNATAREDCLCSVVQQRSGSRRGEWKNKRCRRRANTTSDGQLIKDRVQSAEIQIRHQWEINCEVSTETGMKY